MTSNLKESFERCCRLCAKEQDVTLMIFTAEAEAMLLQNKLNKYLLLEVDEDDKLPKNICIQCCTKLQTVCDFIDTVHESQELLLTISVEIEKQQVSNCEYTSPTPPITDTEIELYSEVVSDDDSQVTSMEISVDPMMILQNNESILTQSDDSESHTEDVSHLHGLDGENVTIKLIKKGEHSENGNCEEEKLLHCCTMCSQNFSSEIELVKHNAKHEENSNKEDYTCSICKKVFFFKCQLMDHVNVHKKGGVCNKCGRNFRTNTKLKLHMALHSASANTYSCTVCGRTYDTLSYLKAHSVSHSNERPFKCNICDKTFKRNQELKFHINQHIGAKPYQCPFCDKAFSSSGNCYSHKRRIHPGRSVGQYNEQVDKTDHIDGQLNNNGEIIPEENEYYYRHTSPLILKRGEKQNIEKDKPQKKSKGHKKPISTQEMKDEPETRPGREENKTVHLINFNKECLNINSKKEKQLKKPLLTSKRLKSGKYECSMCTKTFNRRDNYTYHIYQHTGEKPFSCSYCFENFVTRKGLLIHHNQMHPTKSRPLVLLTKNILLL